MKNMGVSSKGVKGSSNEEEKENKDKVQAQQFRQTMIQKEVQMRHY